MPANTTIDATAAVDSIKALGDAFRPIVEVTLFNVASDVQRGISENLKAPRAPHGKPIDDTGELRGSVQVHRVVRPGDTEAVVRADALHGAPIEYGRRPAGIPLAVILNDATGLTRWVRVKMQPDPLPGKAGDQDRRLLAGQSRRRIAGRPRKEWPAIGAQEGRKLFHQRVARLIARKKSRSPSGATPFFEPAVQKYGTEDRLVAEITKSMNAVIESSQ